MSGDNVVISRKEYEELLESSKVLEALYAGGVDNWEGYGESMENKDKGE